MVPKGSSGHWVGNKQPKLPSAVWRRSNILATRMSPALLQSLNNLSSCLSKHKSHTAASLSGKLYCFCDYRIVYIQGRNVFNKQSWNIAYCYPWLSGFFGREKALWQTVWARRAMGKKPNQGASLRGGTPQSLQRWIPMRVWHHVSKDSVSVAHKLQMSNALRRPGVATLLLH